ncbi:MAG: HAD family phosphatase [Ruminococcaceae bacterium]|nr:HAD family phosphatase [Oscillospiraceae bacterium]
MGKFSNVLFTSDFDCTITDKQHRVPPSNIEAIRYFISQGGLFSLNSGRSVPLLRCRIGQIPTNAPCLCYNGAACYDYRNEKLIYAHTLPEFARELIPLVQKSGLNVCMEVQKFDNHYEIRNQLPARLAFLANEGLEPVFCGDDTTMPWMKLIVCGADGSSVAERPESIDPKALQAFIALETKIREFCGDQCYVTRSMPRLIEISNPNCDKGRAARQLAKELGREILVCAGDAPNDLQMLRQADIAFCPSDAEESILALENIHITQPSHIGCIADAVRQLEDML